jgi:CRISPR-associated endonuclease/helicase Cas3
MSDLSTDQFADYFRALHGRDPYSWQSRLAVRAVEGNWPAAIDLPTGSGKTACIDIAVFALACQARRPVSERSAPRRIFFCVNRRVIVDEAHQRAQGIARRLWKAERDKDRPQVLRKVAEALRKLAGTTEKDDAPPLDVLELRGGIFRDNRWARSATQPTVVCTTIDQLGSRLLFRGYGVSPNAAPVQAALVAYDSLVLLDEAHISQPFQESLERVRCYLDPEKWAEQAIGPRPLIFVPMTATPPTDLNPDDVIQLDDEDRENESLAGRLAAHKHARLLAVADLPKAIVEQAGQYAETRKAVGIIVNRIATAKQIHEALREKYPDAEVELVIGSMRPIDRDEQAKRLAPLVGPVGPDRPQVSEKTSFTVATQCLEVGADYDFDILITECASLDALRQRFGRLNRGGRNIEAHAVILVKSKDIKPDDELDDEKPLDPIYGNALARTWNWLSSQANVIPPETPPSDEEQSKRPKKKAKAASETRTTEARAIDFGIDAFTALLKKHNEGGRIPEDLLAPSAKLHAPVLLPAYVDFWCQTSPLPVPDPDVALFIHGPQRGEPDVQVCWRADLIKDEDGHWCDVVALLPPTSAECMSVPISRVRRWLIEPKEESAQGCDLLEVARQADDDDRNASGRKPTRPTLKLTGVLWRGINDSKLVTSPDDLRPGDTLVLPVAARGWEILGHIPETKRPIGSSFDGADFAKKKEAEEAREIDVAEAAFQAARGMAVLRLHPSRLSSLFSIPKIKELVERVGDTDDPPTLPELRGLMSNAAHALSDDQKDLRVKLELLADLKCSLLRESYPDERGIVLTTRRRIGTNTSWFLRPLDDGEDDSSRLVREEPVTLVDHTRHVRDALARTVERLSTTVSADAFCLAAKLHDWGKVDERFQAMLRRTDRTDAWLFAGESQAILAKSDGVPQSPSERRAARERSGLPSGFRHEMLSVQLAERSADLPPDLAERDLILHLIAAHHGYGRPFASVVIDDEPPDVEIEGVALSTTERRERPPHRLDSGIGERFWSLTRRFGWWGLAFLEALLRLADQQASADEDSGKHDDDATLEPAEASA